MGYTHYWNIAKVSKHSSRFAKAVSDMAKVIRKSPVPLAGPHGEGKPELKKTSVAFNGVGPNAHETFDFPEQDGFCKTAQKPYDIVVTACLAIAKDVFGNEIEVSSDGDRRDWDAGVRLASKVLGRDIDNPIEPRGGMEGVRKSTGPKRFVLVDNGGKTTDRYTIFSTKATGYVGHKSIQYAGFNERPYHPQGFGQHGEISPSQFEAHKRERFRALGKPILFSSLPPQAQKFAKEFMDNVLEEDGQ
jgi:hypothetical protein